MVKDSNGHLYALRDSVPDRETDLTPTQKGGEGLQPPPPPSRSVKVPVLSIVHDEILILRLPHHTI